MKPLISTIESAIKRQFQNPDFNVCDLCRQVDKTQGYLYQIVAMHYDLSPSGLIESYRLNKALELIHDGNLNLTKIACESGYRNYKTFSNAFIRRFGQSPHACRNNIRDTYHFNRMQLLIKPEPAGPRKPIVK